MNPVYWVPVVVVVVFVTVLGVVDFTSTPTPPQGKCVFTKRTLLPDICVSSCAQAVDCTAKTRPYAVIFTQAATCELGVVCLP